MENLGSPRMDLVLSLLDEAGQRRVERLRARNLLVANGGRLPAGITLLPQARTDDGLLDIPCAVTSFRVVFFDNMGNAVPLASNGASFSAQQKEQFRQLSRNKRFYITNVVVHGPDGTTRTLNGRNMEVIVR